jgi:hypothetical protein
VSWADVARSGRWTEWTGLPPLTVAEAQAELGAGERSSTRLGRNRFDVVETPRGRYWVRGDDVPLVELLDPASELPAGELLAALGPPEREGAGRYRRIGTSTTEFVYPGRGLAATIARSYDGSFDDFLIQVLLFAATDMRSFILDLGGDDRGLPRPLP